MSKISQYPWDNSGFVTRMPDIPAKTIKCDPELQSQVRVLAGLMQNFNKKATELYNLSNDMQDMAYDIEQIVFNWRKHHA